MLEYNRCPDRNRIILDTTQRNSLSHLGQGVAATKNLVAQPICIINLFSAAGVIFEIKPKFQCSQGDALPNFPFLTPSREGF